MSKIVALKPRISEKSYALAEQLNTYVFEVPADVNKHDIASSVVSQYSVTVKAVRIAGLPGKTKRSFRRGGRNIFKGSRAGIRKAYVTLAEGDKLPVFQAVEEAGAPVKESK
ncbi:MAG: ribosomal protein [Candidatus Saccharibacteria bacterium]|nr:ribosomal protein [Candidatus Saccharibacteria bacterium]